MATQRSASRKKVKKQVVEGVVHIHASFNNTIITTDRQNAYHGQLPWIRLPRVTKVDSFDAGSQ